MQSSSPQLQEKGETRLQDMYIVYPPPNASFVDMPPPPVPSSKLQPARDNLDSTESLLSASPPPPKPFHFHLPSSNLTRAANCVNEAIQTRDARVSKPEALFPIRERRKRKKRPAKNLELTAKLKPTQKVVFHRHVTLPTATVEEEHEVEPPGVVLEDVYRNRVTFGSPVDRPTREEAGK